MSLTEGDPNNFLFPFEVIQTKLFTEIYIYVPTKENKTALLSALFLTEHSEPLRGQGNNNFSKHCNRSALPSVVCTILTQEVETEKWA